jgi:transposase InsO family protein
MSPYPAQYSVLILDNVSIHKSQHLRNICEEKGIRLEFLPPYSPDFNPIEQAFFYIKNYLRQHRDWVESEENPIDALNLSCMTIGESSAKACFRHAGYL